MTKVKPCQKKNTLTINGNGCSERPMPAPRPLLQIKQDDHHDEGKTEKQHRGHQRVFGPNEVLRIPIAQHQDVDSQQRLVEVRIVRYAWESERNDIL